jgi:hypothetical protein
LPGAAWGEEHVVPLTELRERIDQSAAQREANREQLERFLSSPAVAKAVTGMRLDPDQLRRAIPRLNDDELARLAARAARAEAEMAGGALTNQQLTYIVIALVTALVVTIIFVA